MSHFLDLARWKRRRQYHFFRHYEQPFFNICAPLEVTALLAYCRAHGVSFFLASLYAATRAANEVEAFRYRLRDEGVLVHDRIHTGSTVLRPDETFTFVYFEYGDDFATFHRAGRQRLAAVERGDEFDARDERDDLIHFSVIPWLSFTSFAHARRQLHNDAVPKIVFGRYRQQGGHAGGQQEQSTAGYWTMPVSVEVHHALMDGLHVGRYFQAFEALCAEPGRWAGAG